MCLAFVGKGYNKFNVSCFIVVLPPENFVFEKLSIAEMNIAIFTVNDTIAKKKIAKLPGVCPANR